MLEQTLLSGLVVIWRDLERCVCAHLFRFLREEYSFLGGIATRACHNFDLPCGKLHRYLDHANVLVVIQRGRLACGADGHDAVYAALDLRLDKSFESGFVNFALLEGRHNGCVSTGELHVQISQRDQMIG